MSTVPDHVTFWNGQKMPIIGLGTYPWESTREEMKTAIHVALETGYRHFDAAYSYLNEDVIGEVLDGWIQSGKVKREDLFIVTKLPEIGNREEDVEKFLKKSLSALRLDYVDLYLIHGPVGLIGQHDTDVFPVNANGFVQLDMLTDLIQLWKSMEKQVDAGLVKSIGISNFNEEQIERIVKNARIKPANLQVELHVLFQQKPLRDFCLKHEITVCAYSPLGSPGRTTEFFSKFGITNFSPIPDLINNPTVVKIAKKHKKTSAQVLLKYLTQLDLPVIPKSANPERIRTNFQIFDFTLSVIDMAKLRELDQREFGRTFDFVTAFKGSDRHPENPYPRNSKNI